MLCVCVLTPKLELFEKSLLDLNTIVYFSSVSSSILRNCFSYRILFINKYQQLTYEEMVPKFYFCLNRF